MTKSRQTVAQQSHRRGIAFGAGPHGAKRSLSLPAKVKQTTRRFRLIFEVGAADPFLQIEIKKDAHSTRSPRRRLCASRGRGDPDGGAGLFRVRIADATNAKGSSSVLMGVAAHCEQRDH
jgi:hypothetical protein